MKIPAIALTVPCALLITMYLSYSEAVLCLARTPVNNQSTAENQRTIVKGIAMLALQIDYMLSQSAAADQNILFAPINIVKTLGTIMLGTAGETEKELAVILGMAVGKKLAYNIPELHKELGVLLTRVTTDHPGVRFGTNINIAGAVFIQKGIPVCGNYLQLAKDIYRTELMALDFLNDGATAANIVNQWISIKTNKRITSLVEPPLSADTKVLFAGALYYNGEWEHPFIGSVTRWQTFYLGSEGRNTKESVAVQMMANSGTVPFYQDDKLGYKAIGLPYKGGDIVMFFILPNINVDLKSLTGKLGYNDIDNIAKRSALKETFYVIPKMKLRTNTGLRSTLERLGVHSLFNRRRANFSNLADGIYADEIVHQVEMEVNEIGTTGSAATATIVNRGGYEIFRVDRPFTFFIYNVKVDIITFWGSIVKPTPFITK